MDVNRWSLRQSSETYKPKSRTARNLRENLKSPQKCRLKIPYFVAWGSVCVGGHRRSSSRSPVRSLVEGQRPVAAPPGHEVPAPHRDAAPWRCLIFRQACCPATPDTRRGWLAGCRPDIMLGADSEPNGSSRTKKGRERRYVFMVTSIRSTSTDRRSAGVARPGRTNPTGGSTATDPSAAGSSPGADACTDFCLGVLMVWQKQENAWKLLARQGFKTEA